MIRTSHCLRQIFLSHFNRSDCRQTGASLFARLCMVSAILIAGPGMVPAQTAHFGGAQTNFASGFSNPNGLAIDANGNVYVSDYGHGVVKEVLAVNGAIPASPTIRTLGSFNQPGALAVDPSGDVFVASGGDGTVKEIVAVNGSIPVSPSIVQITVMAHPSGLATDSAGNLYLSGGCQGAEPQGTLCGFVFELLAVNGSISAQSASIQLPVSPNNPGGIAVDRNGNVYFADSANNAVDEVLATNGSVSQNSATRILTHTASPAAVAVDNSGDLFFSTPLSDTVYEIQAINGSIPAVIPGNYITTVGAGLSLAGPVAVDGSGNLYIGDVLGNRVVVVSLTAGNFGPVNVGTTATPVTLNFTFGAAGTLGGVSVLTGGASALDFSNAGGGTCVANTAYTSGQTCTVNVAFNPGFAGSRYGAVKLTSSNGTTIATGSVQGIGVGPQVSFLPATQSVVVTGTHSLVPQGVAVDSSGDVFVSTGAPGPVFKQAPPSGGNTPPLYIAFFPPSAYGVAVDGGGNVYIADPAGGSIYQEVPTSSGYLQNTVGSGFSHPSSVAVDGSGNVYVADTGLGQVLKETLTKSGYLQSQIPTTGLSTPGGVGVDASGNVYIADAYNGRVLKESPIPGGYSQSTAVTGLGQPGAIAVDGVGNVYVADLQSNQVLEESWTGGSYVQSTVANYAGNGVLQPTGIAVDATGNIYIAQSQNFQVLKQSMSNPPSLAFALTVVGATSPDSPQMVTIENTGNAALTFPVPSSGNNPAVTGNFSLNSSAPSACPVVGAGSPAGTLAAGASCQLALSFSPATARNLTGSLTITDNSLNAPAPAYTTQSIGLSGGGSLPTPPLTWATPAPITYGTPLSAVQLNATSTIAGTFYYSSPAGSVLSAGIYSLTVTFEPTDSADYGYATQTVSLTVNQATPGITWASPAAIAYGTALSASQLNATSSVAGSFAYTPSAGVVPGAGTQTLSVTFTPTDTTDYSSVTQTVSLIVNQATPTITWATPAAITYGTALSASQLNATSAVPGSFAYAPSAGAVPGAGTQTLSVTFTPSDTTDYSTVTQTVSLLVNQATPSVSWAAPAAISYGTALSGTQLNATSSVAGTFSYTPASGTMVGAGTQTLSTIFMPTDTADYTTVSSSVALTVNKAVPAITWSTPTPITYGTALSGTQLNASTTVPGTLSYSPAAGTVLTAGPQTLTVTFTPTDTADYAIATTSVTLTVNKAAPAISWITPAPIGYGTALSATQLDATSAVAGTFTYTPAAGTVLDAGSQPLSVVFTPSDTNDYMTAQAAASIVVNRATPAITWTTPAAIAYGTGLSATQLDASSPVAGTFTYSPVAGTVLNAGVQTLTVTFTPSNTTDYSVATGSVALAVNKGTPVISWATPAAITQGTALGATQLDATSTVSGTFTYSPGAGSVLSAGSQTLTTTFTPTNTTNYTTATGSVVLTVNPAPSFTLGATPASLSIAQGASGTSTIALTGKNGFSGSATLAASGLPSGVTASFSTNPVTGSSVLTLTASSTATVGTATVTITGTSGSLTATTAVALTVTAKAGFACHVIYSISSQWPGGFGTAITIQNTGTTAITNWTLTFAFANGQKVTQIWNGNETQSGANVTVTNMSYNGSIPAGGSYNGMGFNGSWNNTTNAVPTSFAVNGTVCR